MEEGTPTPPSGAWTGRIITIVVALLVVAIVVTATTVYFVVREEEEPAEDLTLTIAVSGFGTTSPAAGAQTYEEGTAVAVSATPSTSWTFDRWELDGAVAGSATAFTVTMDANHLLTAFFTGPPAPPGQHWLIIAVSGNGITNPAAGAQTYDEDEDVAVTATPAAGWTFDGWELDGAVAGSTTTFTVTMDAGHLLTAFFGAPPTPPAPVTLRVIGPWSGSELEIFQPVMDAFTNDTGIELEYITFRQEQLQVILPGPFSVGITPGDLIMMSSAFIKQWGDDGHAIDMTALNAASDVSPDLFELVEFGDKQYGGTYTGKAKLGFWYKKSFFAANNLDVANVDSYANFTTLLADIDANTSVINPIVSGDGVGWPLSDITEHFIASFGGAQMHRDLTAGTIAWTDTEVFDVLNTTLVPWLAADYFSPPIEWTAAVQDWWDEDYALYFMGSWITGMVDDPSDLGVLPLPSTIGGTVFGADYFFIPTYTDLPFEAMLFADFLMSNEGQTIQIQQGGHVATATGVPIDAYPEGIDREIGAGMAGRVLLNDLDDVIGGTFQVAFWGHLQALWTSTNPVGDLAGILADIQAEMP